MLRKVKQLQKLKWNHHNRRRKKKCMKLKTMKTKKITVKKNSMMIMRKSITRKVRNITIMLALKTQESKEIKTNNCTKKSKRNQKRKKKQMENRINMRMKTLMILNTLRLSISRRINQLASLSNHKKNSSITIQKQPKTWRRLKRKATKRRTITVKVTIKLPLKTMENRINKMIPANKRKNIKNKERKNTKRTLKKKLNYDRDNQRIQWVILSS